MAYGNPYKTLVRVVAVQDRPGANDNGAWICLPGYNSELAFFVPEKKALQAGFWTMHLQEAVLRGEDIRFTAHVVIAGEPGTFIAGIYGANFYKERANE